MSTARHRGATAFTACVAVLAGALLLSGGSVAAKSKHKKGVSAVVTKAVNAPIPDRAPFVPGAPAPFGALSVPLEISRKRFKGKTAGDVQLTYQTTGLTATAADDLSFFLSAPSGRTLEIDGNGFSGQSIGPVTLTDTTAVQTCRGGPAPPPPPCEDPDATLNPPYVGTARDADLPNFAGVKMRGTWTLTVFDESNMNTSVLNMVSLGVQAQKPPK